jgi:hypothetical protein
VWYYIHNIFTIAIEFENKKVNTLFLIDEY